MASVIYVTAEPINVVYFLMTPRVSLVYKGKPADNPVIRDRVVLLN